MKLRFKIEELLDANGMKQYQLADAIGVRPADISTLKNEESVNWKLLKKISDYFNIPLSYFEDEAKLVNIANEEERGYRSLHLIDSTILDKTIDNILSRLSKLEDHQNN